MRVQFHIQRRLVVVAVVAASLAFPLGVVASHRFDDVPTSNTFHADIDAIADVGVTQGCGVNLYCPDDYVTRGQMAAFLNRLGALQAGKTPVVNADRVDGLHAAGLTRFAFKNWFALTPVADSPDSTAYVTLEFAAPTAGFVLVNSSVTLQNNGCTASCEVWTFVRHEQSAKDGVFSTTSLVYLNDSLSTASVFAVGAGNNVFTLRLARNAVGNGTISGFQGALTAQFSPFSEPLAAREPSAGQR